MLDGLFECPFCGRLYGIRAKNTDASEEVPINLDVQIECPCGAVKYGGPSEVREDAGD